MASHNFKPGDRVWPAGGSFRRTYPDRVLNVSPDGKSIGVEIYPDGLTYNHTPLGRSIGQRPAADYVLAEGYVPSVRAYGYRDGDILGRDMV
jgi:hypothetical protein